MSKRKEAFNLKPIFANSIMSITKNGTFTQFLTYEYSEPTTRYYEKVQLDRDFYEEELETLETNMQHFMDICKNKVNGEYVYPKVIETDIDFKTPAMPYFYWVIVFKGNLKPGINVYESEIEKEELEYNINSIYMLEDPLIPESVESALHVDINKEKRIVKYWGDEGDMVGPTEILRFIL
jgi:hypothetical protein